ncbi:MAG: hypothetical protein JNM17_34815 [Archangium sp.]|nr:hypothetical protein [Archangium sp.]
MELRVPASGRLEWLVQPGAAVRDGAVLARLVVEDHCAIVPILAPGTGVVTWLRPAALPRVAARAVVGLLDATPQELAVCMCLVRSEAQLALARLMREQREVEARLARVGNAQGLSRALLEEEVVSVRRRCAELALLIDSLRAQHCPANRA